MDSFIDAGSLCMMVSPPTFTLHGGSLTFTLHDGSSPTFTLDGGFSSYFHFGWWYLLLLSLWMVVSPPAFTLNGDSPPTFTLHSGSSPTFREILVAGSVLPLLPQSCKSSKASWETKQYRNAEARQAFHIPREDLPESKRTCVARRDVVFPVPAWSRPWWLPPQWAAD